MRVPSPGHPPGSARSALVQSCATGLVLRASSIALQIGVRRPSEVACIIPGPSGVPHRGAGALALPSACSRARFCTRVCRAVRCGTRPMACVRDPGTARPERPRSLRAWLNSCARFLPLGLGPHALVPGPGAFGHTRHSGVPAGKRVPTVEPPERSASSRDPLRRCVLPRAPVWASRMPAKRRARCSLWTMAAHS
jgi:hypothetical protein